MATWSSMLRARRSILWTTTASTSPSSAIRASISWSWRPVGAPGRLAAVGVLVDQVPALVPDVADAGLALGGDGEPLLAVAVLGLLLGRDPQVDHAAHRRPPFFGARSVRSDLDPAGSASPSAWTSSARANSARANPPERAEGRRRRRLSAPGGRCWAGWPRMAERAAVVATWAPLVARLALPGRAQERLPGVARSMMWRRGPVEPMGSHAAPPGPAPDPLSGGHRQVGLIQDLSDLGLPTSRREPEHHPRRPSRRLHQLRVTGQLGGQTSRGSRCRGRAPRRTRTVVFLWRSTPKPSGRTTSPHSAAQRRSDHHSASSASGCARAQLAREQNRPLAAEQVAEALALGQGECPGVVEPGARQLDAAIGRHHFDSEGAEDVVIGVRSNPAEVAEAVENAQPVQSGETVSRRGHVVEAQVR